jgi:hypothetical protein
MVLTLYYDNIQVILNGAIGYHADYHDDRLVFAHHNLPPRPVGIYTSAELHLWY